MTEEDRERDYIEAWELSDADRATGGEAEPTATLIVSGWYSECGACGTQTLPGDERHERVSGYSGGRAGCGARFIAITTDANRLDDDLRAALDEMRPDLPIVEPHEAHS